MTRFSKITIFAVFALTSCLTTPNVVETSDTGTAEDQSQTDLRQDDVRPTRDVAIDSNGVEDLSDLEDLPTCTTCELVFVRSDERFNFDETYFGRNGDGSFYVEAYYGGTGSCPELNSPTPDRTAIVSGLGSDGAKQATVLDFVGDMLAGVSAQSQGGAATIVEVSDETLAFTVEFTFAEGALLGTATATHCPSLDG